MRALARAERSDPGEPGGPPTEAALRAAAAAAQPDAFMSYAREDEDFAEIIAQALESSGKAVWIDRDRIPYASDWRARARAGIDASKAVIFLLTPHWLSSEACRYELEHAVSSQ